MAELIVTFGQVSGASSVLEDAENCRTEAIAIGAQGTNGLLTP